MARERTREASKTNSRHSRLYAAGRGDPRDARRENKRLTDQGYDRDFFGFKDGRLTLVVGQPLLEEIAAKLLGRGLVATTGGKLEVTLGAALVFDGQGRVAVDFTSVEVLTDSTAGTASNTLDAIPDPADSPPDEDALRDDIVANVLPPVRDALASLAAKVNEILETLQTASTKARVP